MAQNAEVLGDRPAPGRLEGLRMLLNTDDRFHGFDRLDDLERLPLFLLHYGVLFEGETLTRRDVAALRTFRDALRGFLVEPDEEAAAALNAVSQAYPLVVRVAAGGTSSLQRCAPGEAGDRVIARQIETLHRAIEDGRWTRMGRCGREDCQWIFYDSSRNRSARWCSADPCGDVMKTRAWRERQRAR
ncbi:MULTISPECIES: CGNR zinc finger domain-containing protein [unclassified Nocardioides]|uniref:CGNR zinc finger domain-containing protein n=1 Tax=unclassified Nocardioides TaxID=2615069 RepID=UPI0007024207|nr:MULTISPECIES: CGNR zinc finger domain-containing protein [unclassified Nocardioides]KRC57007.1 hypothetical protein ASE19_04190 [Nocardioides sp. Root79]KRC77216.1 hypothetical protein ASE20_03055 [Nocardioides sp. Root240]